jgi:hypothetical protein
MEQVVALILEGSVTNVDRNGGRKAWQEEKVDKCK